MIARAEARKISEIFQRQLDSELLKANFPDKPTLAYFEIAANDELDPGAVTKHAETLRHAGYRIETAQLSEKTGYRLSDAALPEKIDVRSQQNNPGEVSADEQTGGIL